MPKQETKNMPKRDHRLRNALGCLSAAAALAAIVFAAPAAALAKTVTLAMVVKLDQVAPEDRKMYRTGGRDLDRIAYDDSKIDPVNHTVPIIYLAHCIGGHWMPVEGTEASSYNVVTHRLQVSSSIHHGRDLTVLFDAGGRMAMLSRPEFQMLIAGEYAIDPRPLTPAEIAAPAPGWNSPNTMPMLSGMPGMPPMPGMGRPPGAPPQP